MERVGEQLHGLGQRPKVLDVLGSGGMPEQEAREPARLLLRRARKEC